MWKRRKASVANLLTCLAAKPFLSKHFLKRNFTFSSLHVIAFFHFSTFNNPVSALTALKSPQPITNWQIQCLFPQSSNYPFQVLPRIYGKSCTSMFLWHYTLQVFLLAVHSFLFVNTTYIGGAIIFQIYLWASPHLNGALHVRGGGEKCQTSK